MAEIKGVLIYVGEDASQTTFYPKTTGDNVYVTYERSDSEGNITTVSGDLNTQLSLINGVIAAISGIDLSGFADADNVSSIVEQLQNLASSTSDFVKTSDITGSNDTAVKSAIQNMITNTIRSSLNELNVGTIPTSQPSTITNGSVWISN